ncbi:MAG: helix-turn-helix domain-containing protein [Vicinamibacterales bacterium]
MSPQGVPLMQSGVLAQHDTAFQPQLGRSVTIDQAAQLLGMSRRTVYYRIREGRLRTIRTLGGSQRVLLESLLDQRQG